MTTFELDYIKFKRLPQINQLFTIFQSTIEEVFETIEKSDLDMSASNSMIEPIVNQKFGNTFHHHNETNKRQHIHKILFISINPYTIKDQGPHQLHT